MSNGLFGILPAVVRYDGDISMLDKVVYCDIDARCNGKGYCWPSNKQIGESLGVNSDTIYRSVKRLEKAGYVRREYRPDLSTNRTLHPCVPHLPLSHNAGVPPRVEATDPPVEIRVDPPVSYSPKNKEVKNNKKKISTVSPDFEEFYLAYPKKRKRPDAEKAFAAANLPPIADLISTLERWKQTEDWTKEAGRYIPYPATWIRAQGWLDDLPTNVADQRALELEEILSGI